MVLITLFAWSLAQPAIIRRHDIGDAAYRCEDRCNPATAHFFLGGRFGSGTGTLIAPRWVLTAAHVAQYLDAGDRVDIGGVRHAVDQIYLHPRAAQAEGFVDVALVRLDEAVAGVTPAALALLREEVGSRVVFEGAGATGTGEAGVGRSDRVRRRAGNRVEAVRDHWLVFRFDAPPDALEDEGISGPGDSGGPAYLAATSCLLGVSSWQDSSPVRGDAPPEGRRHEGYYGVLEHYVRVSAVRDWVEATLAAVGDQPSYCVFN